MSDSKGNLFVRRPVLAMVIAIIITLVGAITLTGLPVEQYPSLSPPQVVVRAKYPGANAIDIEESVATPLEQQINGVDNMLYMLSTNSNDGTMAIRVSFDVGTDPDMNAVLVQNRAAAATARLPESVKQLGVTTKKAMSNVMMVVTLASDGSFDQEFLGNYALINLRDELLRLPGVGDVTVFGSDYSMRIWVKPDRLSQLGVTVPEIVKAINEQNVLVPGGQLGAEPAPQGTEFTYTVRMPSRFNSEEEFGNIIVREKPDGSEIKIKDIAEVELGIEKYNAFTRLNKEVCTVIAIYQAPGSNALEVANGIKEAMAFMSTRFPEGISYDISLDTTLAITAGIDDIIETLIIALILVIFVVFLFLQDWRATLIPCLAIPVSLIGAFIFFPMLGFTINVLSLLGLVLAIGIVVDDAIIVVEAVQVNIERGMQPKEATIDAMKKVTGPVIATTLILVAIFIPVAGMSGITGKLYQQFAITIALSVIVSSVNALTLSPALCSLLLKEPKPYKGVLGKIFGGFNKFMKKSTGGYMSVTNVVTGKIKRGLIFIGILILGMGVLSKVVPMGFIPEEDMGYFFVNIQLPPAASIQRTNDITRQVEDLLVAKEDVQYVTNVTGYSLLSTSFLNNSAVMFVKLKDWDERSITAKAFVENINQELLKIPGSINLAFGPPPIPGLGKGSGFSIMIQDRGGNTPKYLAEQANIFTQKAMERPEIGRAFTPFNASVPQRLLEINKEKALKLGIPLNDIYATVGAYMGGTYVNDFNRFGRLYKTYIQAKPEYRQDESGLNSFFLKNRNGDMVPMSTFIDMEHISGPDYTNRFNLFRSIEVSGAAAAGYSTTQALDALEEVAAEVLPSDVGYSWNGLSYQEKKASGGLLPILGLSMIFVFLILSAQYESWSLPISVLAGTPFAIFGAFLGLYIARFLSPSFENNVFAQVSFVMLIGMAAKNAILIVEFATEEFHNGKSLYDAAIMAAKERFRPILMTAFAFIFGIFPLVIATGSGAEARKVMGMTLLGGMVVATFVGVFLYPMLFVFVGKLFGYEKKRLKEATSESIENKEE
ncbi:efflux RND transporter permease subunit [Mangrovimonas xylaniphaga]|uniref:efflux RND transporter permease subunit n=1 Tax=Mangrovimonas xylaniphaga TaxID=1645915 RepID=UPI0006B54241|nr:efflux RND transporter permease subunit [Mangrovimonas xylaniphaga]